MFKTPAQKYDYVLSNTTAVGVFARSKYTKQTPQKRKHGYVKNFTEKNSDESIAAIVQAGFDMFIRDYELRGKIKMLGEGVSGAGMVVQSHAVLQFLNQVNSHFIYGPTSMPKKGESIVVKISFPRKGYTGELERELDKESSVLTHLSTAQPKTIGGKIFDSRSVVPRFYGSGYLKKYNCTIVCMSLAEGTLLNEILGQLNAKIIANLEKTLLTLWVHGVAHRDFHGDNSMVDRVTGKVTAFDFGRSLFLGDKIVRRIEEAIRDLEQSPKLLNSSSVVMHLAADSGIDRAMIVAPSWANAKHVGAHPSRFHDNALIVTDSVRRCRKPTCTLEDLIAERKRLWWPRTVKSEPKAAIKQKTPNKVPQASFRELVQYLQKNATKQSFKQKTAKKTTAKKTSVEMCPEGYIRNDCIPSGKSGKPSNRCVKKDGPIGKKILHLKKQQRA